MDLMSDYGFIDRYWDAMKRPTLPMQITHKEMFFRVIGHYHTQSVLGGILDSMRMCPQHKFLLSSNDPTTVVSAPENCLVVLRANIHDLPQIDEYLANANEFGKPKVLNIQGGFGPQQWLKDFDWFIVSGFKFAYVRSVIRGVHSLDRPVYVESFVDTVRLSRMPEQIRCREVPDNIFNQDNKEDYNKGGDTWQDAIENLFT